jgi:hypothetical protein
MHGSSFVADPGQSDFLPDEQKRFRCLTPVPQVIGSNVFLDELLFEVGFCKSSKKLDFSLFRFQTQKFEFFA